MAKNLLEGKLYRDKIQKPALTAEQIEAMHEAIISPETQPIKGKTAVKEKQNQLSEPISFQNEGLDDQQTKLSSPEPITRLSVDVTKEMHKMLKRRVIETEQSIREYVVSLIKKDLGLK